MYTHTRAAHTHTHTHTHTPCLSAAKLNTTPKPQEPSKLWKQEQNLKRNKNTHRTHRNTHTHTHAHTHTHLHVQEWAFFLKAAGKLRPLNVLFLAVVAVAEGGNDTLLDRPALVMCSKCSPNCPRRTTTAEWDRVTNGAVWADFTGTTLTCHTTKEGFSEMT